MIKNTVTEQVQASADCWGSGNNSKADEESKLNDVYYSVLGV